MLYMILLRVWLSVLSRGLSTWLGLAWLGLAWLMQAGLRMTVYEVVMRKG